MTHEELEEAVPLYAAGALDRAERQVLEAHLLSGCQSCHSALKDYQSVASLLPFGLSPTQAPRALKSKLMAALNQDTLAVDSLLKEPGRPSLEPGEWMNHLFPPITPARSLSLPWAIGLVAVLLVSLVGYFLWAYNVRVSEDTLKIQQLEAVVQEQSNKVAGLKRDLSLKDRTLSDLQVDIQRRINDAMELKGQLMEREVELETTREQLNAALRGKAPQDEFAALLRRPDAKVVSLAALDVAKGASAVLLYNPVTQKIWLYSANLPECPTGTAYQLWAIDQKPVSVGTFHIDAGEMAHLLVKRLPDFEKARRFAVSLEPAGGRQQPSGPIYLMGQRSS
ncbi:MAG TPA: anti-sigma factor [Nitrospira sp.]|nr:anti-sigma factor [Nitrospira sp.]